MSTRFLKSGWLFVFLALILLSPAALALTCYEVKATFNPSSDADNSGRIRASGWGKFSAFQASRPPQGWFKFTDNKRVFAVNNNTLLTTQWQVDMGSVTSAEDCDTVVPAPLDPSPSSVANLNLDILFCIGWDAHFYLTWSGGLRTGEIFEIAKLNEAFYPIVQVYEPLGTTLGQSFSHTNKEHPTSYRVRINGDYGAGPWNDAWEYFGCSSGGGDPL